MIAIREYLQHILLQKNQNNALTDIHNRFLEWKIGDPLRNCLGGVIPQRFG